jgi:hypothetical protein
MMLFHVRHVAALISYTSNEHHGDGIDDPRRLNGLPSAVDTIKSLLTVRCELNYIVIRGIH